MKKTIPKEITAENNPNLSPEPETIVELYPELSLAQQKEAEYFLTRYLDLVRRIYERIRREKEESKNSIDKNSLDKEVAETKAKIDENP